MSDFSNTFSGGPTDLNGGHEFADKAARAAQEARFQASGVVGEANRVLDRAADTLGMKSGPLSGSTNDQVNQAMNVAGQSLHSAAQQLRQAAPQGAPVAELLERGANYLQATDPNTAISDIEQLIKRYPIQAVGVGLAFGFLLGRRGK